MSGQYPSYPGDQPEGQGGSTPPPPPPPGSSGAQSSPAQPQSGQPQPGQPYGAQPYGHPGQQWADPDPYAHWGLRLAAYLLDALIAAAVYLPLYLVGFGFLMADTDPVTGGVAGGPLTVVGVLLCLASVLVMLAFLVWNYGIRQGRTGQTLGKKIVSIKVVKEDGTTLGTWLSLGRTVLFSVLTSCTCYINALWPLWDGKKQALHDKVVSTVVLKA